MIFTTTLRKRAELMKKRLNLLFKYMIAIVLLSSVADAHHYKGLPHNDYFANYPQVPTMEFLFEDDKREIFLTVYNFQGINLDQVEDNQMVRLYIFLYDVARNTPYTEPTRFEIYSHGELIHTEESLDPQEESIYSIHKNIINQDDLVLKVYFKDGDSISPVSLSFKITKSFFQRYGILIIIICFFFLVGITKKYLIKEGVKGQENVS